MPVLSKTVFLDSKLDMNGEYLIIIVVAIGLFEHRKHLDSSNKTNCLVLLHSNS
jgi:hypothetical protein